MALLQVVVLKVKTNCPCEGCGRKIKKHIKKFTGVLKVSVDVEKSTVRVLGEDLDPKILRKHIKKKFDEEVEIVGIESPRNKVAAAAAISDGRGVCRTFVKEPAATAAVTDELNDLQLGDSTVVLKTTLNCEGCIKKVSKILLKINGVKVIHIDGEKQLVTVEGRVNAEALKLHLEKKFKPNVEIVPMETDGDDNRGYRNNGKGEKTKEERRSGGLKIYDGGEKKKEREGGGKDMERVANGGSSREKKKGKEGGGGGEKEEFGGGDWSGGFGGEKKKNKKEEEVGGGYGYRNGEEKEEERYGHGMRKEEAESSGRMEWENNHNREEMDGGYDSHERSEEGGSGRTHSSDGEEKENQGGGWN